MDLVPGSVNMIDCQNGVLDLRNKNIVETSTSATLFYFRCSVIFPDWQNEWAGTTYWYDVENIWPCNVRCPPAPFSSLQL